MFIVPWPCAGTGTAWPNAAKTTSTIRDEVSTLPAATAAGAPGVHERPLGGADGDRREGTARGGQVRRGQAAHDEVARRARDRERAVEVAVVLRRGAGEVDLDLLARDRDGGADRRARLPRLEHVLGLAAAVGEAARSPPGRPARSRRRARPSRRGHGRRRSARVSSAIRLRARAWAASWARRSPRRSSGFRICADEPFERPARRAAWAGSRRPRPRGVREAAGMLPGSGPPTSAWWARVTAKPSSVRETSVTSGRCVPPAKGSLRMKTSSGPGSWAATAATASGIAPRCTGMCSACATIRPRASKRAVEQSRRSLMFAENADRIERGAHLLAHGPQRRPDHLQLDIHALGTLPSHPLEHEAAILGPIPNPHPPGGDPAGGPVQFDHGWAGHVQCGRRATAPARGLGVTSAVRTATSSSGRSRSA